jgi:hypothetical protein
MHPTAVIIMHPKADKNNEQSSLAKFSIWVGPSMKNGLWHFSEN